MPFRNLLRESRGITCGFKSALSDYPIGFMIAKPVTRIPLPARKHHVRPLLANESNHIPERGFLVPITQGLRQGLGKAEIEKTRYSKACAVILGGTDQFNRSPNTKRRPEVAADGVTRGLAATQGQKRDRIALAASKHGYSASIFVVRVGDHVDDAARGLQPP